MTTEPASPQAVADLVAAEKREQACLAALETNSHDPALKAEWLACCQQNLQTITEFVRAHGWPNQAQYGLAVETAAFLMVQHGDGNQAGDARLVAAATQKQLALLAVMEQSATPGFTAFVTDRVLRNSGAPQRYGTQFVEPGKLRRIEDPAHLDQRRQAMGLGETEAAYLTRMECGSKVPFLPLIAQDPALVEEFEGRAVPSNFTDMVRAMAARPGSAVAFPNFTTRYNAAPASSQLLH